MWQVCSFYQDKIFLRENSIASGLHFAIEYDIHVFELFNKAWYILNPPQALNDIVSLSVLLVRFCVDSAGMSVSLIRSQQRNMPLFCRKTEQVFYRKNEYGLSSELPSFGMAAFLCIRKISYESPKKSQVKNQMFNDKNEK